MADANSQQEPSMEEILASIRRIISEDGEEGAPADENTEAAAEPAEAAEAEDDVLELTQVVDEEEPPPEGQMAAESESLEDTEPQEEAEAEAEAEAEEEEELPAPPEEPDPDALPREDDEIELREEIQQAAADAALGNALISDDPAAAATGSLSNLAAAVDMAHATSIGQAGRTIEDLVKEVVRPMVREWLDAELPGLVERLVEREISRLSRNAEGDD